MLVHPHFGGWNARNDNMITAERTIADISCGTMSGTPAGQAAQQRISEGAGRRGSTAQPTESIGAANRNVIHRDKRWQTV